MKQTHHPCLEAARVIPAQVRSLLLRFEGRGERAGLGLTS